jgi:uroporphyrin-III C-methyltransferase / precorrin-2 dehydrogenase / sirohydrochlorin ferrochelatase
MTLFPAFLKLANRPVLVVGGGSIAASKIPSLVEAGANVTVVAPHLNAQLAEQARNNKFTWLPKPFSPEDLDNKFLVIAATSLREVNAAVFAEAERRQILCNAVDDIDHCHFYYGAIVQRGDLQIAISTNGKSPALAQRLRKELEQQFGPEYSAWLDHLGAAREHLRGATTHPESTKQQLHHLAAPAAFHRFLERLNNLPESKRDLPDCKVVPETKPICHPERSEGPAVSSPPITPCRVPQTSVLPLGSWVSPSSAGPASESGSVAPPNLPGKIFLLGAGPGDPDLLTQKSARLLRSANIVLHDSLVSAEILALIPASANRIDVGKRAGQRLLTQSEINSLLIDAAHKHEIVVRLKGGDPLLFGRAAEEIAALRAASIDFEIVPGISAAFAAAAAAQISLTDRRLASRVLFTTYSRSEDARAFNGVPIAPDTTVVVYMPGPDYAEVSRWLQDGGLAPETPLLVVSKATNPDQSAQLTTIAALPTHKPLPAPALLIVGRVAANKSLLDNATSWLAQQLHESPEKMSIL